MKEKIKTALLTAKGGFVNHYDAAIWLVNYPEEKYNSSNVNMMAAFFRGSSLLSAELDRRHGAPEMIPVTEPVHMPDGTIDHRIIPDVKTRAEREDNADYRRVAQQVSIDLLRSAAVADSNALLVSLIDDAVTEQRRILGHGQPQAAPVMAESAPAANSLASPLIAPTETAEQRQARRYQLCIAAGLTMPTDDYAQLPRGIGKLAEREGIKRQSFAEDVKAYVRRLNGR